MINRTTNSRWRRHIKSRRRQVEDMGVQADEHIERHFFRRLSRLTNVRRFIITWVALVFLLIVSVLLQTRALGNHYLISKPASGGIYTEGIVGTFTNANPLYATGSVDSSVARLVFSSLFKYNRDNKLVGDLATSIESDERGVTYVVKLRTDAKWHDGLPVTAKDVVFTYQTIQNPDAKSPLASSWKDVKIVASDDKTVTFTLPSALSAFPHSLTNGIVPKHLLGGIPYSQLRAVNFNTASPVGSGPFRWEAVEVIGNKPETREQHIGLLSNNNYYNSAPKIDKFILRSFQNENVMIESFNKQELNGMVGLSSVPEELRDKSTVQDYSITMTSEVAVFLKTSHNILSDLMVRRALVLATDTNDVMRGLGYPVLAARGPLLKGMVGYDDKLTEFSFSLKDAVTTLEQAGWKVGEDGIRVKEGKQLSFKLYSQSNSEYAYVSQALQKQWRKVGVDAQVILQPASDLQATIGFHNYDALLYGIAIGTDPDVFAYWHSSQADLRSQNRLNFSEYRSAPADRSLEAGRTRSDATLRSIKYRPFLEAWRNDAPAITLYQPRFLYITRGQIFNFEPKTINSGADRLNNVNNWMIRQEKVPQTR